MINNIGWASYCYAVIILMLLYYLFVLLFFYKKDIVAIVVKSRKSISLSSSTQTPESWDAFPQNDYDLNKHIVEHGVNSELQFAGDDLFRLIQSLRDELEAYVSEASAMQAGKKEMIFSIKQLLSKYPHPGMLSYRVSINSFIDLKLTKYCSIHLTEEEMKQLWKD